MANGIIYDTAETEAAREYKSGYREGFQDGYQASQHNMLFPKLTQPAPPVRCPVCYIDWSKPMGYVCMRFDCPRNVIGTANSNPQFLKDEVY